MAIKLTDVAKLANVSPTTVSRVINNKGYLSKETIEKVNNAIKELGYMPNSLARGLQGKSSNLVGLIVPNISNVFYSQLIQSLENELFKNGYKSIICNSESNPEKEKEYLAMLQANKVDGIISSSHNLEVDDYERIEAPIVAFDRNLGPNIPIVCSDNYQGGMLVAERFKQLGLTNTVIITGNDNSDSPTVKRAIGFKQVYPQAKTIKMGHDLSFVRKQMMIKSILLDDKPDGIFVTNDITALQITEMCKQFNIEVGKDIRVFGYDGSNFIRSYFPNLSTVCQPIDDISKLLVEVLLKKINNEEVDKEYVLPVTLNIGETI